MVTKIYFENDMNNRRRKKERTPNSGLPKAGGDVVTESLVHLINFTASRQLVAPKTPPSASRKTL